MHHAARSLLEGHPLVAIVLDADQRMVWLNAAARALLALPPDGPAQPLHRYVPVEPGALDDTAAWPAIDVAISPAGAVDANTQRHFRVACGAASEGQRLLTLIPIDELVGQAECAEEAVEMLSAAKNFGQLGTWRRDLRSLDGHWDEPMFKLLGFAPGMPTPGFDESTKNLVAEDCAAFRAAFADSLQSAGHYSGAARVRAVDGQLRRLQLQWTVKNGADGKPAMVHGFAKDDTDAWALERSHVEATTLLGAAVDLGRIAIWRHDLRTDRMHYNDNAYAVLGLAPRADGLPMATVRERIHPDDLPAVLANVQPALSTDTPVDQEIRYWRPDGWRSVLTRRAVQRDLDGHPIAFTGVGLDVTEQREETRRAQEMTRRFELATQTAGIGYWSSEPGTQQVRWSEQLFNMLGLPPGNPAPGLADWAEKILHPGDRTRVSAAFSEWVRSGRPSLELNLRMLHVDGTVIDVVSHSCIEGDRDRRLLFGIVIDVTERRAAEAALRRAHERGVLIAQGVGIGTWELDLSNDHAVWDEQMWRLRGLAPASQPLDAAARLMTLHPDDRELAQLNARRQRITMAPVEYEFRVRWPDGSWRWLASRSIAVPDAQGQPGRRIGVNWDTTAARAAAVAQDETAAAQREVQAKSRFLARVSHELRTPLNAVLGFTQLLLTEDSSLSKGSRQRRLRHIESAGRHLLALIDDVLELSRVEGNEVTIAMAPVLLAPALRAALDLVEPLAREGGVQLAAPGIDRLGLVVLADETRLRQVLLNLLSNAIKYNHRGGAVRIEAGRCSGVSSGLSSGVSSGPASGADSARGEPIDAVRITVIDTGRGLTEQQLSHLFEPFNRLGAESTAVEGTGIGLAIAKTLVQRMGGSIEAQSTIEQGSQFVITLRDGAGVAEPASADAPVAAPPLARAALDGAGGTVLYIEDNPVNAMIVSELLARRTDLTLHLAVDGVSGLASARALKPDLLLLDMQLPDLDGILVLQALKADPATAAIPCIALSANATPDDIERALRAGCADYWTKPLNFRAFMASIEALFGPAPG